MTVEEFRMKAICIKSPLLYTAFIDKCLKELDKETLLKICFEFASGIGGFALYNPMIPDKYNHQTIIKLAEYQYLNAPEPPLHFIQVSRYKGKYFVYKSAAACFIVKNNTHQILTVKTKPPGIFTHEGEVVYWDRGYSIRKSGNIYEIEPMQLFHKIFINHECFFKKNVYIIDRNCITLKTESVPDFLGYMHEYINKDYYILNISDRPGSTEIALVRNELYLRGLIEKNATRHIPNTP